MSICLDFNFAIPILLILTHLFCCCLLMPHLKMDFLRLLGTVVAFLSIAFCLPSVSVFCGTHFSFPSLLAPCLSFSAPA